MRFLICILFFSFLWSCKESKPRTTEFNTDTQYEPKWLIGNWERIGEKGEKKTYEQWKKKKDGLFIGMGCTLAGTDTVWKENVILSKKNDIWTFEVTGLGDSIPTVFTITEMIKDKFICVNEANDFPKIIEYAFVNDEIHAEISGGGPAIPFNFKRYTNSE